VNRTALYAGLAALAVVGLAILATYAHKRNLAMLPPKIECADLADARNRAGLYAIPVLGTGSMQPYIPAAPKGADPLKTIVAFAKLELAATYADVQPGDLVMYAAEWHNGQNVMHQAARKDSDGWVMSGTANAHSESRWRVTEANFKGLVARVYVWPIK
jgi:hypothetical protein